MIEIRVHGRGGQGSVTAAELLGFAAHSDGKYAQAFPSFGSERMGAPVQAFVRISDKPIRIRSQVYKPNYVIVQDPTLLEVINVLDGLHENGLLLINSKKKVA
ncbi:MAG: pyruvate ferredoxin oxidoreductase, partial [Planctomycetes bacterium]|nr:pyruvate ferredoxin oxidoreductase [Planctomycetota bacterium]